MPGDDTAFSAMRRRNASSAPSVIAANSGTSVIGSTTTKNSTKNLRSSSIICRPCPAVPSARSIMPARIMNQNSRMPGSASTVVSR